MTEGYVDKPFDEGLQPERTLLAWRRTALSFGLACAASIKVLAGNGGVVVLALGVIGMALAVATYVTSARRYRRAHAELVATGTLQPSGPPAAVLTLSVLALGIACVIYLVTDALAR
ncbi:YidH family protein [Demequina aurantiaca]|uniref:YidH family protein n=1 Tax=Demequina aurantiaca TaxID=676200 RepID=UPI0007832598|nr:DUF202 domain-containing protein [Demequina aurantiaca]